MTEVKRGRGRPRKIIEPTIIPTKKEIKIYYQPHQKQKDVHNSKARFRIISAGRRSGKTKLACGEMLRMIISKWDSEEKLTIGWIAPSFGTAGRGIDCLKEMCRDLIKDKIMVIKGLSPVKASINGHTILFLSIDNPNSIRGYYFDMVIIDEMAYIEDRAYTEVILPTLMDKQARLLGISTPAGTYGVFYDYAMKASGDDTIDFFAFSSYDNPYLPKGEVDLMRSQMPDISFKQECLAEFISTSDMLIHNFDALNVKTICRCNSKKIMGADFAKYKDYTVLMSCCPSCGIITDIDRFTLIDWPEQLQRLKGFYKNNDCFKLIFDASFAGDVLESALRNEHMILVPYKMTQESKKTLVNSMILCLEQGTIKWDFDKYNILVDEIRTFRPELSRAGNITYNAAPGCHDDCVTSLGLISTLMTQDQSKPFLIDIDSIKEEPKEEQSPIFKWMNDGDDD